MGTIKFEHFVPYLLSLLGNESMYPIPFHVATATPLLSPSVPKTNAKKHFVLVHGAGHGAWCRYKVATLLASIGHNVTTLDLAASGVNPKQVQVVQSLLDYVEPLIEFMESLPPRERVILVDHSMGGAVISIAMERFPEKISASEYPSAVMTGPTLNYSMIFEKDLTLALSLMRFFPMLQSRGEIKLSKERYGSVPRAYIIRSQDKIMPVDVQRWMIQKNPPDEVKVINGSDHMVMFSRPVELVFHLQNIAEKY